jgi:hypothetical protein
MGTVRPTGPSRQTAPSRANHSIDNDDLWDPSHDLASWPAGLHRRMVEVPWGVQSAQVASERSRDPGDGRAGMASRPRFAAVAADVPAGPVLDGPGPLEEPVGDIGKDEHADEGGQANPWDAGHQFLLRASRRQP